MVVIGKIKALIQDLRRKVGITSREQEESEDVIMAARTSSLDAGEKLCSNGGGGVDGVVSDGKSWGRLGVNARHSLDILFSKNRNKNCVLIAWLAFLYKVEE
jgi:hypothetical protein